jgi:hypothetical protein
MKFLIVPIKDCLFSCAILECQLCIFQLKPKLDVNFYLALIYAHSEINVVVVYNIFRTAHAFGRWFKTSLMLMQVLNTFRDLEESNILRSFMSDVIDKISKACQSFEVKESAPPLAGI